MGGFVVCFKTSKKMVRVIDELARELGISRSEFIREAVERYAQEVMSDVVRGNGRKDGFGSFGTVRRVVITGDELRALERGEAVIEVVIWSEGRLCRDILRMRDVEGKSYSEIGEALAIGKWEARRWYKKCKEIERVIKEKKNMFYELKSNSSGRW